MKFKDQQIILKWIGILLFIISLFLVFNAFLSLTSKVSDKMGDDLLTISGAIVYTAICLTVIIVIWATSRLFLPPPPEEEEDDDRVHPPGDSTPEEEDDEAKDGGS